MNIAIYPGSFDPITNGHLDMIIRSSKLFDKVIVLIANNPNKVCRFSLTSRVRMIKEATKDISNVEVDSYDGLTVNYAKEHNAKAIIRGLRVVSDFEYERQLAAANEYIDSSIETVFLMSHKENTFISSSTIDEMFNNNVDISPLVPLCVLEMYIQKQKK